MKHSILRKLMLIAVLLTGSHAFAHDFDVDGIYYNILSETDKTVEVTYKGNSSTSYIEYSGSKIIPEKLVYNGDTYSVTSISKSAFSGCNSLTSVTIPNSVTRIGDGAFSGCNSLTSVTIPNSVTSISKSAFSGCNSLTSVTIPNSVTRIGDGAFEGCSKLAKITIPNSVISIGVNVSKDCSKLTSIIVESGNTIYDSRDNCNAIIQTTTNTLITGCKTTIIPNSVTKIGDGAFNGCSGLTSITIPNSVTKIGGVAFYNCSGLTSIAIPNSVKEIGLSAYKGCSKLTSVTIPNSVTKISENVFYDCSNLTSIIVESGNTIYDSRDNCNAIIQTTTNTLITGCKTTIIPNSVTKIGQGAFRNCSSLTSITIPNSVKIIEQTAFYNCSGLTNVTIPNSVTSIGNYAFYNCSGLTEIICENSIPATVESTTFYNITATLYVPVGAREAYASATGWNHFTNIIEDDVKTGVESILAEDVNVSVENGNIVINGVDNANIEVYSTNGQCVYNGTATTIPVSSKGLYIVKVDNKSFKVTL